MLHKLQMGPFKVLTTYLNSKLLAALTPEASPCCVPASSDNSVTFSSDSSSRYTSTVQSGLIYANAALLRNHHLQTSYPHSAHFASSPPAPSPPPLAPGCPSTPPASFFSTDSFRVLQWNAGGLRARSTELLHFFSSHPVDIIHIQESDRNSLSSFRISGFSALRSDRTHSRSGVLSLADTHCSCSVIIFVRQGLSFSELSIFSLS